MPNSIIKGLTLTQAKVLGPDGILNDKGYCGELFLIIQASGWKS